MPELAAASDLDALRDLRGVTLPAAVSAPASPDVPASVASPTPTTADGLTPDMLRLLTAFRMFQMQHSRLVHHESVARGLNATDVRLVFFLASAEDGATPKQAGEYLELSTGAMTSLIDRLAARGHIERRPNPGDRRSIILHLTESGRGVATEIGALYHAAFSAVVPAEHRASLAQAFELMGEELRRSESTCTR